MKDYNVRKPTKEELADWKKWFLKENSHNYYLSLEQNADDYIESYYFGVIDDYISDCPGYAGRLMFVVYGFPQAFELFEWDSNGKLKRVKSEHER